ncbi:hypothetical protein Bca101_009390 [Brassica carinata]
MSSSINGGLTKDLLHLPNRDATPDPAAHTGMEKEKPYWPELFGKVEDLSVSRALKMLRRKTVTDRSIRIKLACLAIISSALSVDQLEDEDAERIYTSVMDVVSLSKNTIAVQGFALALQLVIVEAVPSLTAVVQEACSSSDSDSEDDDPDCVRNKAKKQTLSPAHARDVDKQPEVFVTSIIPQDPHRPVDESVLGWSDEIEDNRVENMLKLIATDYGFPNLTFKGGVTKREVDKMREDQKNVSKRKQPISKKITPSVVEEEKLTSMVLSIIKPELQRIDATVASAISTIHDVSKSAAAYEESTMGAVEAISVGAMSGNGGPVGEVNNDDIINNVLESLSEYSTPPHTRPRCHQVSEKETEGKRSHIRATDQIEGKSQQNPSPSANSHTYRELDLGVPTFSLGLTQELKAPPNAAEDVVADNDNYQPVDDNEGCLGFRKSKRLRTVPQSLVTDYQCGNAIMTRAWEGQMFSESHYDMEVVREKYTKLVTLIRGRCVINVGGLAVTGKELSEIGERNRFLPAKVVDIIMKLVRSTFIRHSGRNIESNYEFLDTRFVSQLSRTYPKFKKARDKEAFVFPKGLVERLKKSCYSSPNLITRFYLPFNLDRKHWIGVCVDCTAGKIFVLDCNPALRSDSALSKDLRPISDMFFLLLKFSGVVEMLEPAQLRVERVKGIAQNSNPADAGITAALLMQNHALFGADSFRCITPSIIREEAHRAAVMLYEFYQQL